MENTAGDVFQRLESAVSAWSDELQAAHAEMDRRLDQAGIRLSERPPLPEALVHALKAGEAHAKAVQEAVADCIALVRHLEARVETAESALQANESLGATVQQIQTLLSDRFDEMPAIESLAPKLDAMTVDIETIRRGQAELTAAHETLRGVPEKLHALAVSVAAVHNLRDEAAAFHHEPPSAPHNDEAIQALREEVQRLSDELLSVRADVAQPASPDAAIESLQAALSQMREESAVLRARLDAIPNGETELNALREEVTQIREAVAHSGPAEEDLLHQLASLGAEVGYLREAVYEFGKHEDVMQYVREEAPQTVEPPVVVDRVEPAPGPPRELTDRTLREYAFDAAHHRRRMGEILVTAGAIGQSQLRTALQRQESEPTRRLGTILIELGATTEIMIARVLAAQLQLPFSELSEDDISDQAVSLVTARLVRNHRAMPVRATNDAIVLAMSNPLDLIAIEDIELATGRRVEVVVATASQVAAAIETFYGPEVAPGGAPARQP